jgi:hypothetical protein
MASTTTSYGYKIPSNLDTGVTVFPDLTFNINRQNSHKHDGADSAPLDPSALVPVTQSISNSNWVASGSGYTQNVVMPSGITFDNCMKEFHLPDGSIFYPSIVKTGAAAYDIFINDSTLTVTAFYK